MTANTYTEEEFKRLLKALFVEKKKVRELEKQLKCTASRHRVFSLAKEHSKLKAALFEKERECQRLQNQIEKVKPAFKKLLDEINLLKSTHHGKASKAEKELEAVEKSLQNVKLKYEERDHEIRTMQQHLAKKIKETAMLRELVDQQKEKIGAVKEE